MGRYPPVRIFHRVSRYRLGWGCLALAVLLLASPCSQAAGVLADSPQDALLGLERDAGVTTLDDAVRSNADFVSRLGIVQGSVRRCQAFVSRYGNHPGVHKVLSAIRNRPGHGLFTSPQTVRALERAVGRPIDLTQLDLEHCLEAGDRAIGRTNGADIATLPELNASLGRCLAALRSAGPNLAVTKVLFDLGRRPRDTTFTSATTLAQLERAGGRKLALSARDLETCVDAYDMQASLKSVFVGDNPPPCGPNEEFCSGVSGTVCCSSGEVCVSSCVRSTCNAGCEAQWCFPGDATVQTDSGAIKPMAEVRIGDRLQVARPDGTLGFEDVYLNTHRDALSSAPFVVLTLDNGRSLTLSPRHFIPVAADAEAGWEARVTKGADEIRPGDRIWSQDDHGTMAISRVRTVATRIAVGAFNPLTTGGTIVVDGVVASAHSDWFLDGVVSAESQATVYQALLAPVRLAYALIGPDWMTTVTEDWGVVDRVRGATTPHGGTPVSGWTVLLVIVLASGAGAVAFRNRRGAR